MVNLFLHQDRLVAASLIYVAQGANGEDLGGFSIAKTQCSRMFYICVSQGFTPAGTEEILLMLDYPLALILHLALYLFVVIRGPGAIYISEALGFATRANRQLEHPCLRQSSAIER
jgi:hypothetical protein